ncbi:MAG: DUF615 domain-containing protein [Burkholderiales bacterium]|jgi:ribosome-associated protein|nr:DUF615 domain-containing protein [Burkholderiales bacterium]
MIRRCSNAFFTNAEFPANNETPSKTRRKCEMRDVQKLGEALATLSPGELTALDLPERLLDALIETAHIKKHEARRRHLQFIGKLMRDVDPEPIRAWFAQRQIVPALEKARFVHLENWRDRLLEEPQAFDELRAQFPGLDRAAWQQRIAAARNERQSSDKSPHYYRTLFRDLKKLFADGDSLWDSTS